MSIFNRHINIHEPADVKSPTHLLATLGTMLVFAGVPLAAFLAVNQVAPLKNFQTIIYGATGEQYISPLTTNIPRAQFWAKISGNKVIWYDERRGTYQYDLYAYDLVTKTEKKINSTPIRVLSGMATSIYGDKIAYTNVVDHPTYQQIVVYDLATNVERVITPPSHHATNPAIYQNKIVYQDDRNGPCDQCNWDLYLYDLNTNTERQVTTNTSEQRFPDIWGDKIVWVDLRHQVNNNGLSDVYLYDLSKNTERRLTSSTGLKEWPKVYGNYVVWTDFIDNKIHLYDLTKNTETAISDTGAYRASIDGDKIVWTQRGSSSNSDIILYDIPTGTKTQITFDPLHQHRPFICGDRIVWIDERSGGQTNITGFEPITEADNTDVYIYDPPGTTSCHLSSPPDNTSPPGNQPPGATPPGNQPPSFGKVTLCHWTAAGKYEVITVAEQAALNGHLAHPGDIIPATEGCKPPTVKEVVLPDVFRRKNNTTTDLSKIADPSKVENFTLDTLVNTIKFKEPVDLSSAEVLNKLNFLDLYLTADKLGVISLDSKSLPTLNKKATLTMKKLPYFKTPRVLVDGKEDKKVVSNIKFSEGVLSFDVSHFSIITVAPTILISEPVDNFKTTRSKINLQGNVSESMATVSAKLNNKNLGALKVATESGDFKTQLDLEKGLNKIVVTAFSVTGASASATISGTLVEKAGLSLVYLLIILLILATSFGVAYIAAKRMKKGLGQQKNQPPAVNLTKKDLL